MRCEECGYRHWSTEWDYFWDAYLCDYCWVELEEELEFYDSCPYKTYRKYDYDDYWYYEDNWYDEY